jgi:two-component system, NarL family, nitrate/nitrite response regulator NarL
MERSAIRLALAMGKSNKEIARDFDLSPATVRAHASAIYLALGAANRTDAVMRARDMGLV